MSCNALFDEDDHNDISLSDKLDTEGRLVGDEAKAFLAGHFSNATHNNYSAKQLFERAYLGYRITVEKL